MLDRVKKVLRWDSTRRLTKRPDANLNVKEATSSAHYEGTDAVNGTSRQQNSSPHYSSDQSPKHVHRKTKSQHLRADNQTSPDSAGHAEHPALRPLSNELLPRSPAQKQRPNPMELRSYSSISSSASEESPATPPQPTHGPDDPLLNGTSRQQQSSSSLEDLPERLEAVDLSGHLDGFDTNAETDVDYTIHHREPVVHEEIYPHVHTMYEPRRTRSIHFHEHRYYIQPIIDPNPVIAPEEHFLEDAETGKTYKLPGSFVSDDGEDRPQSAVALPLTVDRNDFCSQWARGQSYHL